MDTNAIKCHSDRTLVVSLQGRGALIKGGAERGVRGRQTGDADSDVSAERAGDDGGERGLAEEGGGPAGAGKTHVLIHTLKIKAPC